MKKFLLTGFLFAVLVLGACSSPTPTQTTLPESTPVLAVPEPTEAPPAPEEAYPDPVQGQPEEAYPVPEAPAQVEIFEPAYPAPLDPDNTPLNDLVYNLRSIIFNKSDITETGEMLTQPFFTVMGDGLLFSGDSFPNSPEGAQVQVYVYSDDALRQAEADQITPDGSGIGTSMVTWIAPPHFWTTEKLIVLYVGSDLNVVRMLTYALGDPLTQNHLNLDSASGYP